MLYPPEEVAVLCSRVGHLMDVTLPEMRADFGKLEAECRGIAAELQGKAGSAKVEAELKPLKGDVGALKKLHRDVWLIATFLCCIAAFPGMAAWIGSAAGLKLLWTVRDVLRPPGDGTAT